MDWKLWIVVGLAVVVFVVVRHLNLLGAEAARDCLRRGGKVIDVRTAAEYREKHVPGALNVPLDRLREEIGRQVPDREQPVLLHCLSGGRSGVGRGILKRMGYRNVFNLGSYRRAARIVGEHQQGRTG